MAELLFRIFELEHAFRRSDLADPELLKYFPVALIACIEGYFRMAIQEMVDAGEPYLSNAEKASANIKFDFALLRSVHGKRITVGELISHSVPLSRLEHIESIMSTLLGDSFFARLRKTVDRWEHKIYEMPETPMLDAPDSVLADVARTFELRHIICHEIASAYGVTTEEIQRCFQGSISFLKASSECISQALSPNAPLTQSEMNIASGQSFAEAEMRLAKLVAEFKTILSEPNFADFLELHSIWLSYSERLAKFEADSLVKGGTMWPAIYASTHEAIIEQKIKDLIRLKSILV
ncbi:MAG: DUF1311 domain-containing protein [Caldilinea sp. CFX5]|nr:DUF1311 domain-containing protein [Caldilinea sp. CFX5]